MSGGAERKGLGGFHPRCSMTRDGNGCATGQMTYDRQSTAGDSMGGTIDPVPEKMLSDRRFALPQLDASGQSHSGVPTIKTQSASRHHVTCPTFERMVDVVARWGSLLPNMMPGR